MDQNGGKNAVTFCIGYTHSKGRGDILDIADEQGNAIILTNVSHNVDGAEGQNGNHISKHRIFPVEHPKYKAAEQKLFGNRRKDNRTNGHQEEMIGEKTGNQLIVYIGETRKCGCDQGV